MRGFGVATGVLTGSVAAVAVAVASGVVLAGVASVSAG